MIIRRFTEADAEAVSELIIRTIRISNVRDYPAELMEELVKTETPDHVLQRDQDRYDGLLIFRTVDVDAVLVVNGEELLPDHRDHAVVRIVQFEIELKDVAAQLPVEAFDIGDILVDVEDLRRKLELTAVRH